MMKTELPNAASCGLSAGQSVISCADCKSSWRLEKELPIQSLTSCFPGPALLGDLKDDDKIKLSVFVLASGSERNPPCIAALHLENLNSPWKIGHLQTWDTEYVADRDTLFNAQHLVCKILNQQELPKVKKEPCQDEKCIIQSTQIESIKPLGTEDKQTQTSGKAMQENTQNIDTSFDKLEHNLDIVTESNSEMQSNIPCETKNSDMNDSSKEKQQSIIDDDFSVDIKDEPVGDSIIKKEELGLTNEKLESSSHKKKLNTSSDVCLNNDKSKPMRPSIPLKNKLKKENTINTNKVSLPVRKDKLNGDISNHTNVSKLKISNIKEHNSTSNMDNVMNIKEEPIEEIVRQIEEIGNQSKSCDVDNSHLISYNIKEELLEQYLEGEKDGHLNQTTFKVNKNKIIVVNSGKKLENINYVLQKEEIDEAPIDIKEEPIINPDCAFNLRKNYNKLDKGMKESSLGKCLKNIKSPHVSSEKESNDNSILMLDTKELQDILKCVHDNIGNASETQSNIVQNANTKGNKENKVINVDKITENYEEKSLYNGKEKFQSSPSNETISNATLKSLHIHPSSSANNGTISERKCDSPQTESSIVQKSVELIDDRILDDYTRKQREIQIKHYQKFSEIIDKSDQMIKVNTQKSVGVRMEDKIVSKVSSRDDCNENKLPNIVSIKNADISGVIANITEKILVDINARIKTTNINSTVKEKDVGNSLEKNCRELETLTLKPTSDKSKIIKKELLDKSEQKLTSNEDLSKLVLTRNKNQNDWNVLVNLEGLDNVKSESNDEKSLESVSNILKSNEKSETGIVLTRNKNKNDWNVLVTLDNAKSKSTDEIDKHSKLILEKSKGSVSNISKSNEKSSKESVFNISKSNTKNETVTSIKTTNNFGRCLENQNPTDSEMHFGKQESSSAKSNNCFTTTSSKLKIFEENECSKLDNDGNKFDEKDLLKKVKQSIIDKHESDTKESKVEIISFNSLKTNKVECKTESILNNVRNVDRKVISSMKTDTKEKDNPKNKRIINDSQNKKGSTKEKQTIPKQTKKSSKKKHRHNTSSSSSSSSSNSSSNSSSSESESCSSSSEFSDSSSSESGSSERSSCSGSSSRSSSSSSTRSNTRSSRRSRHAQSKLKKSKNKDHIQEVKKDRNDEDAIIISDESEDEIKIKLEKMSKGYESANKSNEALSLNSINVLVDEKNDGFVCEAQNAPNDINIITRPEYIIIAKKSLGNLKVTECDNGKLVVGHEKLGVTKDLSQNLVKCDKIGDESHKEEEVNKDCSIQDYCNMNTSLQDVLSVKKLSEVKAKMKKRQNRIKMHRKSKETVGIDKSPNNSGLENISDTEELEDSTENPFCKLSVSSISNNRFSDDSHLLLGDSYSDVSVDIVDQKKSRKRSHSKTLNNALHRKCRRKGEDLQKVETLRKERLNTWISHVNDNLSPDHLKQSKSRKRKIKRAEKSRHSTKHKNERSKHKSSHNDRHSKKRKKRKRD